MASGAKDYWQSSEQAMIGLLESIESGLLTGSDLLNQLDALDGTMDGRLDLTELNSSNVVVELQNVVSGLNDSIDELVLAVAQLVGVHTDTTSMVAFSSESWGGSFGKVWTLIADVNVRRNMLRITLGASPGSFYSRDGSTNHGSLNVSGDTIFYDPAGVWGYAKNSTCVFTAYEEWAT